VLTNTLFMSRRSTVHLVNALSRWARGHTCSCALVNALFHGEPSIRPRVETHRGSNDPRGLWSPVRPCGSGTASAAAPGLVADRFLRSRAAPGDPAASAQLNSRLVRALPCPALHATCRRNPGATHANGRYRADQAATPPTKPPISICILDEAVVPRLSDGQHCTPDCVPACFIQPENRRQTAHHSSPIVVQILPAANDRSSVAGRARTATIRRQIVICRPTGRSRTRDGAGLSDANRACPPRAQRRSAALRRTGASACCDRDRD
jgi:hypothetical protein